MCAVHVWLVACGSGVWCDRLWFAFRDPVTVKKLDMTVFFCGLTVVLCGLTVFFMWFDPWFFVV